MLLDVERAFARPFRSIKQASLDGKAWANRLPIIATNGLMTVVD